jgi:hypothetical protein
VSDPEDLRCGVMLKVRACKRAALWPGGHCPRCGYGAETFEDWARGIALADPEHQLILHVRASRAWSGETDDIRLCWEASMRRRKRRTSRSPFERIACARGVVVAEELAVIGDQLWGEGILNDEQLAEIGTAIAKVLRQRVQRRGDTKRADVAAAGLRRLGLTAMASDDYVFLPVADAERLLGGAA